MDEATELSQRLSVVLTEIRDIMEKRKERVEELRDQISFIENENEDLERKINELILDAF
jgi:predicted  nucleic acid-binding Zn-ribbon protein